jgi:LysM repeat protein
MKRKRSWFARFLALVALIAAVVAVIAVASNTNLHSSSSNGNGNNAGGQTNAQQKKPQKPRTKAKTYEVQSGDTLTSIARKTGVKVAEIQALNPEVDPQTLIAGEVLKLQK